MKRCVWTVLLCAISGIVQISGSVCPEYYYTFPEDLMIMNLTNPSFNWDEESKKPNSNIEKKCVTDFRCADHSGVIKTACNGIMGANETGYETFNKTAPNLGNHHFPALFPKREIEDSKRPEYSITASNFIRPSNYNEASPESYALDYSLVIVTLPGSTAPVIQENNAKVPLIVLASAVAAVVGGVGIAFLAVKVQAMLQSGTYRL